RMEQLLERIEKNAKQLAGAAVKRTPIAQADLDKLITAIKGNGFDNGKLSVLKLSASQAYFTSDQAKPLVSLLPFSDGRKQSAILLYPRLTDPVNFATVLSVLPFDADKQAVLRAVEKK